MWNNLFQSVREIKYSLALLFVHLTLVYTLFKSFIILLNSRIFIFCLVFAILTVHAPQKPTPVQTNTNIKNKISLSILINIAV